MTATSENWTGVRYLCVAHLARRYTVSPKTIYRMVDRGELPKPRRIGRLLRWHPADIAKWEAGR